jgi:hypothetical protein
VRGVSVTRGAVIASPTGEEKKVRLHSLLIRFSQCKATFHCYFKDLHVASWHKAITARRKSETLGKAKKLKAWIEV